MENTFNEWINGKSLMEYKSYSNSGKNFYGVKVLIDTHPTLSLKKYDNVLFLREFYEMSNEEKGTYLQQISYLYALDMVRNAEYARTKIENKDTATQNDIATFEFYVVTDGYERHYIERGSPSISTDFVISVKTGESISKAISQKNTEMDSYFSEVLINAIANNETEFLF